MTDPTAGGAGPAARYLGPEGLTVAKTTVTKFVEPAVRLYEQEPG